MFSMRQVASGIGAVASEVNPGGQPPYAWIIDASDYRAADPSGNQRKSFLESRDRFVVVQVVGLDVGDQQGVEMELAEGTERLVCLENERVVAPRWAPVLKATICPPTRKLGSRPSLASRSRQAQSTWSCRGYL